MPPKTYFEAATEDANDDGATTSRRTFGRIALGAAAGAVAVPTLTGQAAAHFESGLEIQIQPWCDKNEIEYDDCGVVLVAVEATSSFDPTDEPVRYRFGAPDVVRDGDGARPLNDGFECDVTGDGTDDLVLKFPVEDTGFDGDESSGRLEWERDDSGEHGLSGTDSVTLVESPW
ncbi:hypothetical protein [Halostagnicola kamekurae]|uniref:Uncharacterized protein n=1 Tax=Halostagnicola kamekurae TaxID=619731 RepID=A0A1I6TGD4_9EURY|nr:hypothetical protein [Halostagnicola kamekurae]SFS88243.1 hypothetical protein SAMN04488556_3097 [Halostagnicola kamekurae]